MGNIWKLLFQGEKQSQDEKKAIAQNWPISWFWIRHISQIQKSNFLMHPFSKKELLPEEGKAIGTFRCENFLAKEKLDLCSRRPSTW